MSSWPRSGPLRNRFARRAKCVRFCRRQLDREAFKAPIGVCVKSEFVKRFNTFGLSRRKAKRFCFRFSEICV